jgi:hypothetical protein
VPILFNAQHASVGRSRGLLGPLHDDASIITGEFGFDTNASAFSLLGKPPQCRVLVVLSQYDAIMLDKIRWFFRKGSTRQIGRRGANDAVILCERAHLEMRNHVAPLPEWRGPMPVLDTSQDGR